MHAAQPEGEPMAKLTLEQRVAALEQAVTALKSKGGASAGARWWEPQAGAFKNDPVFDEAQAYGRYFRKTGREAPPDWKPGDPIPEPDESDAP
jgi:hypothetical protein